jgi:hypothetical protein
VKRITSIGLILLMSLQCCYQLGVITYFHLNRDYIAQVLCINKERPITMCYGQCFLERSLDLADDTNTDQDAVPVGKDKVYFPVFLVSNISHPATSVSEFEADHSPYVVGSSSNHISAPFHPPTLLLS